MNLGHIDPEKLERLAAERGISLEELERALRLHKSAVARIGGSYASDGSGDRE